MKYTFHDYAVVILGSILLFILAYFLKKEKKEA
jgi:hypothetical protein